MPRTKSSPPDLKEACVVAAHAVIAESGVENLSLRDVARRLGVSHQAPYKHFTNRDDLLAEVIRRCFERFARHLSGRAESNEPMEDMSSMGERYLQFARNNPLEYRLMFGTPWPSAAEHPDLVRDARYAFDVLRQSLFHMHGDDPGKKKLVELDALFVWSAMHGLASIMESDATATLALSRNVIKEAAAHTLKKVSLALTTEGEPQPRDC